MSADDRLAGIGQFVKVEADDFKASGQILFSLQRRGREPFQDLLAAAFLGPENKHDRAPKAVHRKTDLLPIRPLEGAGKRRAEDLAAELVALEGDHLEVAGEAFRDDFLQVGDEPVVAEFECHDHGKAQNLRGHRCVEVAGDKRAQGLGARFGFGTLLGQIRLRKEQVGLQPELGEFVGSLDQFAAGFEEGLPMFRRTIEGDELLAGAENKLKDQEAAWGVRVRRQRFLRIANHPLHGKPMAGLR